MKTSFDLMKSLNENALPKIKKTRVLGENQKNLKEYYQMKDNEHIIWDSEIDYYDEDYMEYVKANQYQDYLDDFEPSEPMSFEDWLNSEECYDSHYFWFEDSGIEEGDWDGLVDLYEVEFKEDYDDYVANYKDEPLDFEQWYKNYINDSSYDDWEILEDDLKNNVFPEIDKQINHNCLLLSGNYGSNYPDFRPSGAGGKLFTGTGDFRNYMAGFDRVCITTQNGILGAICNDHDGTISGQFYTAPEDLTELAQLMGYKEEESNYGTIADDLEQDLANEYLEVQQLTQFMDKLVPIKDTITAYSVNESEKLEEKLNGNEIMVFSKKAIEAKSEEELKKIANEIRYYSEPTYTRCMEIINGDGSVQYKAGQMSDIIFQLNESEEHDLSKDLLGDEANKRKSEDQRTLETYLQLANEIKDGKNDTITLDSAKELVKSAYIKAKGYLSFEPEEIDKRIAKDIPELFGESEELIEEEIVSDKLTEVKSQGNVYMLQDNDKYIVGEDYNKEENLIENAEIYTNKEEADKDYFSRCDITRDGEQVDPTEKNPEKEEITESEDLDYRDSKKDYCKVYYAKNTSGYTSLGLIVNDTDKKFQLVSGQKLTTSGRTSKRSKKQIWDMAKDLANKGYEEVRGPSSVAGSTEEA